MKISWRIKEDQWQDDSGFQQTRGLLARQRDVVDEVCFIFNDGRFWHGWWPEEKVKAQSAILARRIATLHEDGIKSVGVNFWPPVGGSGSVPSDSEWLPRLPFQPLVGPDGNISDSKAGCIRDPACLAYVAWRHTMAAQAGPDFIWNDEYRGTVCYCDHCLRAFDGGQWMDRAELVKALENPGCFDLRRAWVNFTADGAKLFTTASRAAVDKVNPKIEIGLMMVNPDIASRHGDYAERCIPAGRIKKLRPGHGWYEDYDARGLLRKLAESGRMICRVGAGIDDIQHEWEVWPGGTIDKGNQATLLEVTGAIAVGCTGVAMNAGPAMGPVDDIMQSQMAALAGWRAGWARMVEACRGTAQVGLHLPMPVDIFSRISPGRGGMAGLDGEITRACAVCDKWQLHGIPLCPSRENSCGILLNEVMAMSLKDEELTDMLSGFAILDGGAAQVLTARHLTNLTGVLASGWRGDTREFFANHPINGSDAGLPRWRAYGDARILVPISPQVEVIGDLRRVDGPELGASATIFRNDKGGRIAVLGYEAWGLVGSSHRWRQLEAIIDWGTNGDSPLRFDRLRRVVPWFRRSPDRRRFVLLLANLASDHTGPFTVELGCEPSGILRLNGDGSTSPAKFTAGGKGRIILNVEADLAPWDFAVYIGG